MKDELTKWQKKYYEDMMKIAEEQILKEAKHKRKLYKEDDYIIYCMFKKLTAGQCKGILDELIDEGIYPCELDRLFNSKKQLANFIIHRKLPAYKEIKEYWCYYDL